MFKSTSTTLFVTVALPVLAQGVFQNLDFESGTFVPIPGDPYSRVEWAPAMPGWEGYLGSAQIDWMMYNNLFLGNTPGIAIWGPDNPTANYLHGHYFVVLQSGFAPGPVAVPAAIAQTAMIPVEAQSLRFYASEPLEVTFDGQPIPLSRLGGSLQTYFVYGGDVRPFASKTGELRFTGSAYLDYIRFSTAPIPEPRALTLLAFGCGGLLWLARRKHGS